MGQNLLGASTFCSAKAATVAIPTRSQDFRAIVSARPLFQIFLARGWRQLLRRVRYYSLPTPKHGSSPIFLATIFATQFTCSSMTPLCTRAQAVEDNLMFANYSHRLRLHLPRTRVPCALFLIYFSFCLMIHLFRGGLAFVSSPPLSE